MGNLHFRLIPLPSTGHRWRLVQRRADASFICYALLDACFKVLSGLESVNSMQAKLLSIIEKLLNWTVRQTYSQLI